MCVWGMSAAQYYHGTGIPVHRPGTFSGDLLLLVIARTAGHYRCLLLTLCLVGDFVLHDYVDDAEFRSMRILGRRIPKRPQINRYSRK